MNQFKRLKLRSKKQQQGITLLLSILLLAAIMAISFSLTTILFIELRSSNDLLKTEGSLYAATGVGEQALFNLKRNACPGGASTCYVPGFDNSVSLSGTPQTVTNNSPIFTDKVVTGSLLNNTVNKYDFCGTNPSYDPQHPGKVLGCQYGKVTVNYITSNGSSDPLYAYLCEWDPNTYYSGSIPCADLGPQSYWLPPCTSCSGSGIQEGDGSVKLSPNINTASWELHADKQQELIITNPSGSGDIYFSVVTYGLDKVTPKGLPFVGSTSIDVSTTNGSVGRKIRVTVPNGGVTAQSKPTYVQGAWSSGGSPFSVAFPGPVSTGNDIIVGVEWFYDLFQPQVTDDLGNSFTEVAASPGFQSLDGNYWDSGIHWFVGQVTHGGTDAVHVSGINGNNSWSYNTFITEYSGLLANPFDVNSIQRNTNTTTCSAGTLNTTAYGDLIVGMFSANSAQGAGFTQRLSSNGAIWEDELLLTGQTITPTASCTTPWEVVGYGAAFKRK